MLKKKKIISKLTLNPNFNISVITALVFALTVKYGHENLQNLDIWAIAVLGVAVIIALLAVILVSVQPMRIFDYGFTVPLVPLLAAISIFLNIFLVAMLDYYAWVRFGLWMIIGKIIPQFLNIKKKTTPLSCRPTNILLDTVSN